MNFLQISLESDFMVPSYDQKPKKLTTKKGNDCVNVSVDFFGFLSALVDCFSLQGDGWGAVCGACRRGTTVWAMLVVVREDLGGQPSKLYLLSLGQVFDQIFGLGFDQGLGEGKNHKYSLQYYPA